MLDCGMTAAPAKQRDIVDRLAIYERLTALGATGEPDRRRVTEALKEALQAGRAKIRARFEAGALGSDTVRSLSFLMDQLIRSLHDFVTIAVYPSANPTAGEHMGVVAVGGYGRGELAPYSDIDLLFLLPYKSTPHTEQVVEYLLYTLWDLGLKVGHATPRSRNASARRRPTSPSGPRSSRRAISGATRSSTRTCGSASSPTFSKGAPPSSWRQSSRSATTATTGSATAATRSSPTSRRARAGCAISIRSSV